MLKKIFIQRSVTLFGTSLRTVAIAKVKQSRKILYNFWIASVASCRLPRNDGTSRPPGPSWFDMKIEGSRPDHYWSLGYPLKLTRKYGGLTYISPLKHYLITGPKEFEHVLKTNANNYQRYPVTYGRMQALFGKSFLVTEGEYWKSRRKIVQPAFHQSLLQTYAPAITQQTETLLLHWKQKTPKSVNILTEMNGLTFNIALNLFCNQNLPKTIILKLMKDIQFGNWYVTHTLFIHRFNPSWNSIRFHWHLRRLDKNLLAIIRNRRQRPTEKSDLLNMLLEAKDEQTNEQLHDTQILAELKTILLTGHETTGCSMAWMWYLLAKNPECREALEHELQTVLGGREPTREDIPLLPITRAILLETFRLFPPIWVMPRMNIEADELCGYKIPANSIIALNIYALHRNPHYWENANTFYPQRFLKQDCNRHPFAYLPFSSGPHTCIANNLALVEAILLTASLAQKVRFELPKKIKVSPEPCISLRPHRGITMQLKLR